MLELLKAAVLGLVEGITEFLPISSTGHLIVSSKLIGAEDSGGTFELVIQLGAVLAVAWKRRHGGLGGAGIWRQLLRCLAAAAVMGAAALATARLLAPHLAPAGLARHAPLALLPVAVGAIAYFAAARLLGIGELAEVAQALRRRRGAPPRT